MDINKLKVGLLEAIVCLGVVAGIHSIITAEKRGVLIAAIGILCAAIPTAIWLVKVEHIKRKEGKVGWLIFFQLINYTVFAMCIAAIYFQKTIHEEWREIAVGVFCLTLSIDVILDTAERKSLKKES